MKQWVFRYCIQIHFGHKPSSHSAISTCPPLRASPAVFNPVMDYTKSSRVSCWCGTSARSQCLSEAAIGDPVARGIRFIPDKSSSHALDINKGFTSTPSRDSNASLMISCRNFPLIVEQLAMLPTKPSGLPFVQVTVQCFDFITRKYYEEVESLINTFANCRTITMR